MSCVDVYASFKPCHRPRGLAQGTFANPRIPSVFLLYFRLAWTLVSCVRRTFNVPVTLSYTPLTSPWLVGDHPSSKHLSRQIP